MKRNCLAIDVIVGFIVGNILATLITYLLNML